MNASKTLLRGFAVTALTIAAGASAGCGENKVAGEEVASSVSTKLEQQVGQKPDEVDCPDLPAKQGSKVTCTLTAGSDTVDVAVTVKTVKDGKATYDVVVADQVN